MWFWVLFCLHLAMALSPSSVPDPPCATSCRSFWITAAVHPRSIWGTFSPLWPGLPSLKKVSWAGSCPADWSSWTSYTPLLEMCQVILPTAHCDWSFGIPSARKLLGSLGGIPASCPSPALSVGLPWRFLEDVPISGAGDRVGRRGRDITDFCSAFWVWKWRIQ